ncbi:leucine-rich repeat protein [Enterococcus faecalis]
MSKKRLTKKHKKKLLTMFTLMGVATSNVVIPTEVLAETLDAKENNEKTVDSASSLETIEQAINIPEVKTIVDEKETEETSEEIKNIEKTTSQSTETNQSVDENPNMKKTARSMRSIESGVLTINHTIPETLSLEIAAEATVDKAASINKLVITGSSTLTQSDWLTLQKLTNQLPNVSELELLTPDTIIPDGGLANANWLVSLNGQSITNIGKNAFSGVSKLRKINLGIQDTTTFATTFASSQSSLQSITLNAVEILPTLTSSDYKVKGFSNFTNLNTIIMENVKEVGAFSFYGLQALKTVQLPMVEIVGDSAFYNSGISTTEGLQTVKTIGTYAFFAAPIADVNFPNAVTIGTKAFANYNFGNDFSPMNKINLPQATAITSDLFENQKNIVTVNLGTKDTTTLTSLFASSKAKITNFTLNNVESTPDLSYFQQDSQGFKQFTNLTSVTMENVTKIGARTFTEMSQLNNINFPKVQAIGEYAFYKTGLINTDGIKSANTIGKSAFEEVGLREINFPEVTTVASHAFYVNLGMGVANGLTNIYMPKASSVALDAFTYQSRIRSVTLGIIDTSILSTLFKDSLGYIQSFTLDSVIKTPNLASGEEKNKGFSGFSQLKSVTMKNVNDIGNLTFCNTPSLVSVDLPKAERIGNYGFFNSGLKDTNGLKAVKLIEEKAFNGTFLNTVDFPELVKVGKDAFGIALGLDAQNYIVSINAPKLTDIDSLAFSQQFYIKTVTIGITDTKNLAVIFGAAKNSIEQFTLNNVETTSNLTEAEAATLSFGVFKSLKELIMPKLKNIGDCSFINANVVPKTLFDYKNPEGSIVEGTIENVGYKAFKGLKNTRIAKMSRIVTLTNTAFTNSSVKVIMLPQSSLPDTQLTSFFDNNPEILGVTYGKKELLYTDLEASAKFGNDKIYNKTAPGVQFIYQWKKDSKVVDKNTTPIYEIAKFAVSDIGDYSQIIQMNIDGITSEDYEIASYQLRGTIPAPSKPELDPVKDIDTKISGKTTANAMVYLVDSTGELTLSAKAANEEGNFELVLPTTYKAGTTLYVQARSEHGNSEIAEVIVQETVKKPEVDEILEGDSEIKGLGKPDNIIVITDGTNELGSTIVDQNGTFTLNEQNIQANVTYHIFAETKKGEKSEEIVVTVEKSKGTITVNPYQIGEVNLTGTYSGNVKSMRLYIEEKSISKGGDLTDGVFTYYCGAGRIKAGQKVKIEAYDRNQNLLDMKEFIMENPNAASLSSATYSWKTSMITGDFTGDIAKAKLSVNNKTISYGGTFKEGRFSYYVKAGTIKKGDKVLIEPYDKYDSSLGNSVPVNLAEAVAGEILTAQKKLGSTVIEGTFTGDIKGAYLKVNGVLITKGGTFKDGKYTFYVGNRLFTPSDIVTLDGYVDKVGTASGADPVKVNIEFGNIGSIESATRRVGSTTITGSYIGDIKGAFLKVNNKLIAKGGTFKEGQYSFYIGAKSFSENDIITLEGYNEGATEVTQPKEVIFETGTKIVSELNYKLGTSSITGIHTGEAFSGQLKINDKVISRGGTFTNGLIQYYVKPGLINGNSQKVNMDIFNQEKKIIQENVPVLVVVE